MTNHSFSIDQRKDVLICGFNSAGARGMVQLVEHVGHGWAHIMPIGSWGARIDFGDDGGSYAQEHFPDRSAALLWLCTNLADATRLAHDGSAGRWEQVEVPTHKPALIAWLNRFKPVLHEVGDVAAPPPPMAEQAPSYGEWSCALDEAWEHLPLARQLHFAAIAMENARGALAGR